jgi:hypothetical protein
LAEPVLVEPVLVEPVLVDPVSAPPEVVSVGLVPLAPPEPGELDAGDGGVEVLLLTGVDTVALGLAAVVGVAESVVGHWVLVGSADVVLPVALLLAVEVALPVAVALAVPVAVDVAVAVEVSPGPVLPLTGLPLDPLSVGLLGGLLAALLTGVTLGVTDLAGVAAADDGEVGAHTVANALLWAAEVPPGPTLLAPEPTWVPAPFTLGAPLLVLGLASPTAVPSCTKAWRSGGNASATPMANTAQAAARAGRSSPYRQSRCCRGA